MNRFMCLSKKLILSVLPFNLVYFSAFAQGSSAKVDNDEIGQSFFSELRKNSNKSDAEVYQAMGYAYLRSYDLREKAAFYFNKALELDPALYWSWYNLGIIHLGTDTGNKLLNKAIGINPDCIPAYYWLAYSHCIMGQDDKAIPVFNNYLKLAATDPAEAGRINVAREILAELIDGIDGDNLKKIRELRKNIDSAPSYDNILNTLLP
ncbi:MAG: hypothetical protein ABH872_01940 [Candidatus Omnitrophota bacterium]